MIRATQLLCVGVMLSSAGWVAALDRGMDSNGLDVALSLLPEVDRWQVDRDGHLVSLDGRLTPEGSAPPARVSTTFLDVHGRLFGAAKGSEFNVESVWRSGDLSVVMIRQSVDGFWATVERVEMAFSGSVLESVSGTVLDDLDVPMAPGETMGRGEAVSVALSLMGPTMREESTSASRILFGASHRRCWRLETVAGSSAGPVLQAVVIDASSAAVLDHAVRSLPGNGGDGDGADGDGLPAAPIDSCAPVEPPVGQFNTSGGQALWVGADAGCGRWEFDWRRSASLFHGDCLETSCDPYPSTDQCDHGEIRRDGLAFGEGLERFRFSFLAPDRELFMRLRWGPGDNHAAPFLVREAELGVVTVEVELSGYDSWDSAKIEALTLELVDDHLVWIRLLDLWPGPWLEFAAGPELTTDPPGGVLIEGEQVTILQDVRNAGCLLELGTHDDMRAVDYTLYRRSGSGRQLSGAVCTEARIQGRFPPESAVQSLPVCGFRLPEPGTWELEAVFSRHPSPPVTSQFVVEPATRPDLAIDLSVPIDLYSGSLGGWPCRADLLDLSRYDDPNPPCNLPWVVTVEASSEGLGEPVESRVLVWGRPDPPVASPGECDPTSGGWYPMAWPLVRDFNGGGTLIEIPLDRDLLEAMPLGQDGWSVLDLRVEVEPVDGEIDWADNVICLASWIPVADGALEDAMGPTWVDDDYFLDPEHWPPHGLAWTGVIVDHEGGSASYDPDSALAVVTVADGANQNPRLVWFEERPGDSVSGALLRYRRNLAGYGGDPYLDAGAEEADGIPEFALEQPDHSNRSWLTADSQWRTVVWRRGLSGPFGGYPVPLLADPERTGDTVSLHLAPDVNCLLDEPGCPNGLYPSTSIDVVGVWREQGPPPPDPIYSVIGLRVLQSGQWLPPPARVAPGQVLDFAVEVRNIGSAAGTAVLSASVDVVPINENQPYHLMTGSATVTISPGESHNLQIGPAWVPGEAGLYSLSGPVTESGDRIGLVASAIEVLDDPTPCPVPAVNLP